MNCTWGEWEYSECSKSCGNGFLVKTRSKSVVEAHGGVCPDADTVIEVCGIENCPGKLF